MRPKISVILPVYNEEKLLPRALDSIPKAKDIEVIIIDDGSTDESWAIADRWRAKNRSAYYSVQVVRSTTNYGVAMSMNKGFDLAKGQYIVSLSSDDYYVTDFEPFRKYLDGKNDLVFFDLEVNDGSIWHLDEQSCTDFVGAVKFIRRTFLGDTRVPYKKWHEDTPFTQELYKKKPKMAFTGIVLKHYNWPHEGSLIWQATHQKN